MLHGEDVLSGRDPGTAVEDDVVCVLTVAEGVVVDSQILGALESAVVVECLGSIGEAGSLDMSADGVVVLALPVVALRSSRVEDACGRIDANAVDLVDLGQQMRTHRRDKGLLRCGG